MADEKRSLDFDAEYIEFVRKLEARTRSKKISWSKTPQGYLAETSTMIFSFTRRPYSLFAPELEWGLFTVRRRGGNEIINVESPGGGILANAMAMASPMVQAVNSLYIAVQQVATSEVTDAIRELDEL